MLFLGPSQLTWKESDPAMEGSEFIDSGFVRVFNECSCIVAQRMPGFQYLPLIEVEESVEKELSTTMRYMKEMSKYVKFIHCLIQYIIYIQNTKKRLNY